MSTTLAERRVKTLPTNPLFNDRKLKLGTFSTNLGGGCAISTIDGTLKVSWPNTLELGRMADEMEFEAHACGVEMILGGFLKNRDPLLVGPLRRCYIGGA